MARKRTKWGVAPIAAGAAVLVGADPVLARVVSNTIEPTADLSARGRVAEGTAIINCTDGERIDVTVTFTQGPARGTGRTHGRCTGEATGYPVKVVVRGRGAFQPGHAEACASAVNTDRGQVVDTRDWCRSGGVELIEE